MIFFNKKRHPLPKFPPNVGTQFRQLCELLSDEDAESLIPQVDQCLAELENDSRDNSSINIDLGRKLADRSKQILARYSSYDDTKKPLILGAVRYFAVHDDSMSERDFITGFDDDVKVMNHVLEELGIDELYIDLF